MKAALVHDWLTGMRGGEKVLEVFCGMFPDADIFTLIHVPGSVSKEIERHKIHTSFLQNIPGIESGYRYALPIMPCAIESFDLSQYDFVLSTSHCVAKGCRPGKNAVHVNYCFTPMRYIWDQFDHYFGPGKAGWATRLAMNAVRPYLQRWDVKSSRTVHHFSADSVYVQKRIKMHYGRDAEVIYPHADTEFYTPNPAKSEGKFYMMLSALAPYKRLDIAIEAFNKSKKPLKIIGSGQSEAELKKQAGANIEFLGWRSNEEIRDHLREAKALIFPGTEDFGIVPVEAMSCGLPVIAYGEGGAMETVVENETGLFFREPTADSLNQAVEKFEKSSWNVEAVRRQAEKFSKANFISQAKQYFAKLIPNEIR